MPLLQSSILGGHSNYELRLLLRAPGKDGCTWAQLIEERRRTRDPSYEYRKRSPLRHRDVWYREDNLGRHGSRQGDTYGFGAYRNWRYSQKQCAGRSSFRGTKSLRKTHAGEGDGAKEPQMPTDDAQDTPQQQNPCTLR